MRDILPLRGRLLAPGRDRRGPEPATSAGLLLAGAGRCRVKACARTVRGARAGRNGDGANDAETAGSFGGTRRRERGTANGVPRPGTVASRAAVPFIHGPGARARR